MKPAPLPEQGQQVWRYLKLQAVGRENAVRARELAHAVGMPERTVRAVVHELRCLGVPVGSAVEPPTGFYVPADREEADACSRHLWARVAEIAQAARSFDRAARDLGLRRGQPEQVRLVFGEEENDAGKF